MHVRLPTALLLLTLLVPATLAQGGNGERSRFDAAVARLRNIHKLFSTPRESFLDDHILPLMGRERHKQIKPYWDHSVKQRWIVAKTGMPVNAIRQSPEEEKAVAFWLNEFDPYLEPLAQKLDEEAKALGQLPRP